MVSIQGVKPNPKYSKFIHKALGAKKLLIDLSQKNPTPIQIGSEQHSKLLKTHFGSKTKTEEGLKRVQDDFKQIGNNQRSQLLEKYSNQTIKDDFKVKNPKSRETIKTRLLACSNCHQRVCRDVNASFKIIHNLLSKLDTEYKDLDTTKFLKKRQEHESEKLCHGK